MTRRSHLAALLALVAATAASADEGLYAPPPPPGSAFVRIVDAKGVGGYDVVLGTTRVSLDANGVSDYAAVPATLSDVALPDGPAAATLAEGAYQTVVVDPATGRDPVVIRDEALDNPAKAGLRFYNLTADPAASLILTAKNAPIFEGLGPLSTKFRTVGAATVALTVRLGDKDLTLDGVEFKRRMSLSVFVTDTGSGPKAFAVPDVLLP